MRATLLSHTSPISFFSFSFFPSFPTHLDLFWHSASPCRASAPSAPHPCCHLPALSQQLPGPHAAGHCLHGQAWRMPSLAHAPAPARQHLPAAPLLTPPPFPSLPFSPPHPPCAVLVCLWGGNAGHRRYRIWPRSRIPWRCTRRVRQCLDARAASPPVYERAHSGVPAAVLPLPICPACSRVREISWIPRTALSRVGVRFDANRSQVGWDSIGR